MSEWQIAGLALPPIALVALYVLVDQYIRCKRGEFDFWDEP